MAFEDHAGDVYIASEVTTSFLARLWRSLRRRLVRRKARKMSGARRLSKMYQRRHPKRAG
jgi:hypothetical protein